ncbi:MAG TPA: hypothetical protein VEJ88_07650, partial [Dissulfurispiraceae bacterium]|nr:hypothetical protein [Dissulfurispiraceae bacterium]
MKSKRIKDATSKRTEDGVDPSRFTFLNHISHSLSPLTFYLSPFFHVILIILAGLIVYSNTFHVSFQFDDYYQLIGNPVIRSLDNFFSSSVGYDYNPRRFIGYLSFALNYHFGGLDVTGYHIVNLAIHIANSILVYFLVLLTFRTPYFTSYDSRFTSHISRPLSDSRPLIAFFSALLFAVHPVQTQAVTYIVQRFASLAAMFYLMSVVFYI